MKLFDFTFDKAKCIIYYTALKAVNFKIKIVVCDFNTDCPLYTLDTITNVNGWIVPISAKLQSYINNSTYPGFYIKIYDETHKLLQYELITINGITYENKIVYYTSEYEPLGASYIDFFYSDLLQNIDMTGVVVDAGANVGFFTLYAHNNYANRIYSIEPDISPYYYLYKNFNMFHNIILINKALSHNTDDIQFCLSKTHSVSNSEFAYMHDSENTYTTTLSAIDINSILAIENKINLLKLDIEGSEFKVMEYLNEYHFNKIDQFFIEFHNNPAEIVDKLKKNDYIVEYRHSTEDDVVGFIYAYKLNK